MKFMTTKDKMERRLDEDATERRRERQEREVFYSIGQGGSSKSTSVTEQRIGKAPIFTPPDKPIVLESPFPQERPWKQLFPEKGVALEGEPEETPLERSSSDVND